MLLSETYLSLSKGKGIGLFAKEKIKKNTKYWIRDENFDRVFNLNDFKMLKKQAKGYVKKYGFQERSKNWYLCSDNARFTNHSNFPNTQNYFDSNGNLKFCTALNNIEIDEEILCDYKDLCLTCIKGVKFEIL